MQEEWRSRLTARMKSLGITPADVTRLAGLKPSMMHDILKRGATPSVENLYKIAVALGTSVGDLVGDPGQQSTITPTGRVVGSGVVLQEQLECVNLYGLLSKDHVALKIDTNFLVAAGYRPGDVICGPKTSGESLANLVGSDCIVCDKTNRLKVGVLIRSASGDRWFLAPASHIQHLIDDIDLLWAAPITLVIRTP